MFQKVITMTKKGIGTVQLVQNDFDNGLKSYVIVSNGVSMILHDAQCLNSAYKQYLSEGWTVKPEKESRKDAPKKPEKKTDKVKKTREEALTEKYGDKEHRTQYIKAKESLRKYYGVKYNIWGKVLDEKVKNALDKWEAAGRPALSC